MLGFICTSIAKGLSGVYKIVIKIAELILVKFFSKQWNLLTTKVANSANYSTTEIKQHRNFEKF